MRFWLRTYVCALTGVLLYFPNVGRADEAVIAKDIASFFQTDDAARRAELAREIESDPAYDRSRVGDWLHRAELFKPLDPGRTRISVAIDDGSTIEVTLRIPGEYDHRRPYPLIYALHGAGGSGDGIIDYVEHLLGADIDQYLVAAPTDYRQVIVHSTTPPSNEHLAVLQIVRKTAHVESDRVFAIGYSRGGHAAWTLAVLHADQFAGVVPVAGTLILQDYGKLFDTFLPNVAYTPVLACWGEDDVMSADYVSPSADGGIAGLNRQLCILAAQLELPVKWYEVPGRGHGDIDPPRADLDKILAARRLRYPPRVDHVFRSVCQGQAWWIEAHAWRGPSWDDKPLRISFRAGENPDHLDDQAEARARAIRGLLGEVRGEIEDQEIKVYRKKISELTVWIGDGMVDWNRPISLKVNGRKAFEGELAPDLLVCLTQAARTYDFDRLRWAGLRFKSGSRTRVVTGR